MLAQQVRDARSTILTLPFIFLVEQGLYSNLTFGAGGKDKDGKTVAGWGYYEVRAFLVLKPLFSFIYL
jgi:Na+-transporting NADH:ubiquinone oxidoreductase subunit NqrC